MSPRVACPGLSRAPLGPVAAALSAALLLAACKGGRGDTCRCASDCGGGLECYAEGQKSLDAGQCFKPAVVGSCVESQSLDSDSSPVLLTEPPTYYDLGSSRDLGYPGGSLSDSMTSLPTTGTTTVDTTGTTTLDTTGTSTGDTTGTSTGTTGDTSTGTSTGTTGDTTGTTGTTGDTSSGTTDGSSSGGSSGSSTG